MSTKTLSITDELKAQVREVLARHDVRRTSVFGSVARGEATAESDLDLLVEFPEGKSLFDLVRLERELEQTLGIDVDVLTFASLNWRIRDSVLSEQISII